MKIRLIERKDLEEVCKMTHELAAYEKLADKCKITVSDLERAFFTSSEGSPKAFICEYQGKPVGYIMTFFNFSSFLGKKGLYLEDLYIRPEYRRNGFGKQALAFLAKFAIKNGCQRFEWSVLDWNTPAIDFYKSLGAEAMSEWTVFRMSGDALQSLASKTESKVT